MNFRRQALVLTMIGIVMSPICAQNNAGEQEDNNTLITVHAEDAFLPSILAILAKESGYNIVTGPNVNKQDKVSIHLDEVPIEQAINLVVRAVGLSYEVVGNSFLVADPKKLKEMNPVEAHKEIFSILKEEMKTKIHALEIEIN